MQTVASRSCGQGFHGDKGAENVAVLVIKILTQTRVLAEKRCSAALPRLYYVTTLYTNGAKCFVENPKP